MRPDRAAQPAHWYSTNLVGVATPVLASAAFNAHPVPLRIAGTREAHAGLFALLERSADLGEAQDMFGHYLEIAFGLRPAPADACASEQRRWRSSYLKLLQGWGLDANSGSGAVLKGWVESRFGLVPTFHRDPLGHFPSPAWIRYLEEKAASRYHNNCIQQQLDLLYEFCQWTLLRFNPLAALGAQAEGPWVRLWRGSNRAEKQLVEGELHRPTRTRPPRRSGEAQPSRAARRVTMRLNNLVSFALDRDAASCFGDWVFEARAPLCKLLFYPGLLPRRILGGEGELLVIGGNYELEASYE
jgi:NAD+--dinitrogen-reductase ADP-D-ribosyltransferase